MKFDEKKYIFKSSKGIIGATERKERKMLVCIWKVVFAIGRKVEHLVARALLITWSSIGTDSLFMENIVNINLNRKLLVKIIKSVNSIRGHPDDYNRWARAGNKGWSYAEVLPYFKKMERIGIEEFTTSKYRGRKGNVDIQHPGYHSKLLDAFLEAGREFGYEENDPNDEKMLGFSQVQATTRNGKRWSASKAYLRPIKKRANLFVSMRSWVTRILIDPDTKVAYGVEFIKNRQRYRVNATKEVILSAGAIASPQLLMLSGVGPAKHLKQLKIPVIQNLKVGYNLQDHVGLSGLAFVVNEPITISESSVQGVSAIFSYYILGRGPFTLPGGAEGLAFVKTPNSTLGNFCDSIVLNETFCFS